MSQNAKIEDALRAPLDTAIAAAREAGAYLIGKQANVRTLYKKSLRDNLLDADLEAEAIIINKLRTNFPTFSIFAEERGQENASENSSQQWVIDPLDGSANFQHGSPLFAISIGLLVNNIPTLSIIYLPARDEMFTAMRGHGATLNGHTILVSQTSILNEALIHVGDFTKTGNSSANAERVANIAKLANQVSRIRMIGTAVTDLAHIACGRADAHIMYSNHPWDVEAGRLLLIEAGGAFSVLHKKTGPVFIYSNGSIHKQLIELISSSE